VARTWNLTARRPPGKPGNWYCFTRTRTPERPSKLAIQVPVRVTEVTDNTEGGDLYWALTYPDEEEATPLIFCSKIALQAAVGGYPLDEYLERYTDRRVVRVRVEELPY